MKKTMLALTAVLTLGAATAVTTSQAAAFGGHGGHRGGGHHFHGGHGHHGWGHHGRGHRHGWRHRHYGYRYVGGYGCYWTPGFYGPVRVCY